MLVHAGNVPADGSIFLRNLPRLRTIIRVVSFFSFYAPSHIHLDSIT